MFVNVYVNVQKQTKGYEPAENTRELYYWIEQQLTEIGGGPSNRIIIFTGDTDGHIGSVRDNGGEKEKTDKEKEYLNVGPEGAELENGNGR